MKKEVLRVRVSYKDNLLIGQEALKAVSELPETLRQVFNCTDSEIPPGLMKDFMYFTGATSVSNTPATSFLTPTWQVLDEAFSPKEGSSLASLRRQLDALIVSDFLSTQITNSSAKKKKFFQVGGTDPDLIYTQIKIVAKAEPDDKTSYVRIREKAHEFQTTVEEILKKVPKKEDDMLAKLRLISACIENANGSLFRSCEPYLSRDFLRWLDSLRTIIGKNGEVFISPFTETLLFGEKLNEIWPSLHYWAWRDSFIAKVRENRQQAKESKFYEGKEHIQYFLAHPSIWQPFWQAKAGGNSPRMDEFVRQDSVDHKVSETMNKFRVNMDAPLLIRFFLQDEATERKFLETTKIVDAPQERMGLYRKLAGAMGIIKNWFIANSSLPFSSNALKDFLEREGLAGSLREELGILSDDVPGILYVDSNLLVAAKRPKNSSSKDKFLEEQGGLGREILYISSHPWMEGQIVETSGPKQEQPKSTVDKEKAIKFLELEHQETTHVWPWGEVSLLEDKDLLAVLDILNSHFGKRVDLTADYLFELLSNYSSHATLAKADLILPPLLPKNHPLANLQALGIIGIEHLDKEGLVRFVIAKEKIGIETNKPQKLILAGKLNAGSELELPNAPSNFSYSPLHLFLNAASLWGKTHFISYAAALSKDEERKTHHIQQTWKDLARTNGLPLLIPPEGNFDHTVGLVRIPIGEKTEEKIIRLAFAQKEKLS